MHQATTNSNKLLVSRGGETWVKQTTKTTNNVALQQKKLADQCSFIAHLPTTHSISLLCPIQCPNASRKIKINM